MKLQRAWLIAAAFGLVAAQFIGCSDPQSQTTGSSSGSSGDAGAGGTGGNGNGGSAGNTSSSGMPPECMTADDCKNNGPTNFCGAPECKNGKCNRIGLKPPGTPLPSQLYGDCEEKRCNEAFDIASYPTDDPYDDGKFCTVDKCMDGVLMHEPIMQGMLCTNFGSQGVCDGNGSCVPCIDNVQACTAPYQCSMNKCVGPKCINGMKDPGESDIDCGAITSQCPLCGDDKTCTNSTQCASGVCVLGKCALPNCMDNVKNGSETGFDCGGPDCGKCPDIEGCTTANDCQSGVCKAGVCEAPSCTDAVQNGTEGGIDCGGTCATPCP